ncbi:alpha/beta fold hydrolase [Thiorhodovibrio frisius]|uniref:Putative hydrolase or acyltransferase of alpha/beta superfamily n=1 Tax=Thiorhodovibrio frisius TaxID=631362 RepID=H8YWU7_9GAMM|nr:alpha/beta fold hydrolase [Thiorhodovibrio frisius]EIC22923.1 putative hydrolase or acyltransferase of alpha/beta superfamily [Thiorhodovibrio frisius]WPL22818.1 2-succinyl-6-hydroxy-2,4-cyclohexadiene-1-carboxylate synthase [Thiorhodovibrio frisius]
MMPGYHTKALGPALDAGISQQPRWLLLHGFTGSHLDWIDLWPRDFPALVMDLPGHGRSPDPKGDFAQEIARLLAALPSSIERIAGYSLGGRIALALMAQAPARFQELLILSAHPGLEDASERAARCRQDQIWIDLLRDQGIKRFASAWQRQALFRAQHLRAPMAVAIQHRRRLSQRPEGLARALACFGLGQMPPTWPAIPVYNGHLHWISGAQDAKFCALGEQVCQIRPATTHDILPDCGHNPLIEAPDMLKERLETLCGHPGR